MTTTDTPTDDNTLFGGPYGWIGFAFTPELAKHGGLELTDLNDLLHDLRTVLERAPAAAAAPAIATHERKLRSLLRAPLDQVEEIKRIVSRVRADLVGQIAALPKPAPAPRPVWLELATDLGVELDSNAGDAYADLRTALARRGQRVSAVDNGPWQRFMDLVWAQGFEASAELVRLRHAFAGVSLPPVRASDAVFGGAAADDALDASFGRVPGYEWRQNDSPPSWMRTLATQLGLAFPTVGFPHAPWCASTEHVRRHLVACIDAALHDLVRTERGSMRTLWLGELRRLAALDRSDPPTSLGTGEEVLEVLGVLGVSITLVDLEVNTEIERVSRTSSATSTLDQLAHKARRVVERVGNAIRGGK